MCVCVFTSLHVCICTCWRVHPCVGMFTCLHVCTHIGGMQTCVCVPHVGRVCIHIYLHAWQVQRLTSGVFLCCSLLYPLETKLLSELEACCCLARLGCPARSQDPLISALSSGVTGMHGCFQLLCGCRRCKLRFLTLTQQALLLIKSSLQGEKLNCILNALSIFNCAFKYTQADKITEIIGADKTNYLLVAFFTL